MEHEIKLYSYFRSSSSYRVRAALGIKQLAYEYIPIHLVKDGGQQHTQDFKSLNPMGQVPCLVHSGQTICQSMAILQYIDRVWPTPVKLFPDDPLAFAKIVELCEVVNSGIQPIQNLHVLNKLEQQFSLDQEGKKQWARYWIDQGFQALEQLLTQTSEQHAYGNTITAADLFIVPQVYNANRFGVDMSNYPVIEKVNNHAMQTEAFKLAAPEQQPDAKS